MSDAPASDRDALEMKDILARIDRQQAETRKFAAEQNKLAAEAAKLTWDRWMSPLTLAIAVLAALLAGLPTVSRLLGWGT